ncbi:MAG: tetratricopeptide repeat protein [Nibricoccus sp.]
MRSTLCSRLIFGSVLLLLSLGVGLAQEIVLPAPLMPKNAEPQSGNISAQRLAAQRAMEMGFSPVAVDLYQKLIDNPAVKPDLRNQLLVDQATALLEDDRAAEAGTALKGYVGLPTPALQLRLAMVAVRQRRMDEARSTAARIPADQLDEADRGWLFLLQGMLAEPARAAALFQQAVDAARNEIQRTRFSLAREEATLKMGEFSEPRAAQMKQQIDKLQGRGREVYFWIRAYAIELNGLGKKSEAITLLQRQLQALPVDEKATADEWRLLLGVISGADEGIGRNALGTLLASGVDRAKQRVAVQMLARASKSGGNRDDFRRRLDDLVGAAVAHPLLEDLLLFRAQMALGDKNYPRAEGDANRLLEQYPGSQYKGLGHSILAGSAWETGRYRNAANQATEARKFLPPGETRAQLGVMLAEAWFRAGLVSHSSPDFRNAADAYAAAVEEVPAGIVPGQLMFQRLLSELEAANVDEAKSDRFNRAQELLEKLSSDPRFDADNRWKAEWNFARALEAAGEVGKAYARLNRAFETNSDVGKLPADLKAQLGWLQATLAFKAGEPARAITLADALLNSLESVEPVLRSQISSLTMLLQAQSNFALTPPRPSDALERLRKLRAEHPKADAAAYSYIVEADYHSANGQLVDAQGCLKTLAEEYKTSSYAPYALYQAAQYAERRSQKRFLDDAFRILQGLIEAYPNSEMVFYARMKQGNLLRLMNDNPSAQTHFEQLVNDFPRHQDVLAAKLALADCHAAQATSDASHQEKAATLYEGLMDMQGAPIDIRVEAGYKYGLNLTRRGDDEGGRKVWGQLIGNIFPNDATAETLGAKGRFWVSKTLFDFADLLEREHKPEQAIEAYNLILRKNLPYVNQAQERLNLLRSQGKP